MKKITVIVVLFCMAVFAQNNPFFVPLEQALAPYRNEMRTIRVKFLITQGVDQKLLSRSSDMEIEKMVSDNWYKHSYEARSKYNEEMDKCKEKHKSRIEEINKNNQTSLYNWLNRIASRLSIIYAQHRNPVKDEFETTATFVQRKKDLDKKLKDETRQTFERYVESIADSIENNNSFNFDLIKYNADKQIYEVEFGRNDLKIKGKLKMPPEVARNFKNDRDARSNNFSFYYDNVDLKAVGYTLVPAKMSVYSTDDKYEIIFEVPKNARDIVLRGSELWRENPYAKNLNISIKDVFKERNAAKAAAEAEAAAVAAAAAAAELKTEEEDYKTIKINNTLWMAKNMNLEIDGSYCYNDIAENCDTYGRLYIWEAAQEICPEGWRLPSNEDWQELAGYAGSEPALKLKANYSWVENCNKGNCNGIDDFDFTALAGGYREEDRYNGNAWYETLGDRGYWWTVEFSARMASYSDVVEFEYYNSKEDYAFSVRCVK